MNCLMVNHAWNCGIEAPLRGIIRREGWVYGDLIPEQGW